MPTYVMLTNLTAEGVRTLKNNPGRVAEVNEEVEQIGAKVVAQYATLGQYDFVTIVEAPDERDDGQGLGRARLARDDDQPDADRDRGRRPGRRAVGGRLEGPGRWRRRARARDRAGTGTLGPTAPELLCAPGNAGIAAEADCLAEVGAGDVEAIVGGGPERNGVELVVVGPEAALVAGVVDALEDAGIAGVGTQRRRRLELEGSKAFAKELMREAGVADRLPRPLAQPRARRSSSWPAPHIRRC